MEPLGLKIALLTLTFAFGLIILAYEEYVDRRSDRLCRDIAIDFHIPEREDAPCIDPQDSSHLRHRNVSCGSEPFGRSDNITGLALTITYRGERSIGFCEQPIFRQASHQRQPRLVFKRAVVD